MTLLTIFPILLHQECIKKAKTLCLPYYACVFSSTKLVIRAEQYLPGTEGERRREGGGRGQSVEMTQKNVCTCE
jgi:hypothetical protein